MREKLFLFTRNQKINSFYAEVACQGLVTVSARAEKPTSFELTGEAPVGEVWYVQKQLVSLNFSRLLRFS